MTGCGGGHTWCAQVSQLSRTQDAGSGEPGGAHVSGAGQRPEAKDHSVPPPDAGASSLCPASGRRESSWDACWAGEAGHAPSLAGRSPQSGPALSRAPEGSVPLWRPW